MPDCSQLEPFLTPYVDGELDRARREAIDEHIRICAPCWTRVSAERAVRRTLLAHRRALEEVVAPAPLRRRCAAAADAGVVSVAQTDAAWRAWRLAFTPLVCAAAIVLVLAGAGVYELTMRSSRFMAAELVADHVKCFGLVNRVIEPDDRAATVEATLESSFGWRLRMPERAGRLGLELVGARPCLYGEGRVAHIMYRHNGRPMSVFILPKTVRADEVVEVMGHEARIWPSGDRTFVLVARERREELEPIAAFVQASLR
jgi:anti-sigma factor RsiW